MVNKIKYIWETMKKEKMGYAYTLPAVIVVSVLLFYPIIYGIYMTFHDISAYRPAAEFVGLENYRMMIQDPAFYTSLFNTFIYVISSRLSLLIISLGLAIFLDKKFKFRSLVRTGVFAPMVITAVAAGIMWQWLFTGEVGLINYLLQMMGLPKFGWLSDQTLAMFSVVVAGVWRSTPLAVIIFLGGLQNINPSLYEAAEVDGANSWDLFRRITLPLLVPTILIVMIYQTMAGINHFTSILSLTGGGPVDATRILALFMYETSFRAQNYSYGATLSMVLFTLNLMMAGTMAIFLRFTRD